jgi:uncharacterized protein YraI
MKMIKGERVARVARYTLAAWMLLMLLAPRAHAKEEEVEVTTALIVRAQPRSDAGVVERVPEGRKLALLGKSADGSWVYVRTLRHVGWAPRSLLKLPKTDEPAPVVTVADGTEPPLARNRPGRPEAWVSHSQYHEGRTVKATVSAARAELYGRPARGGVVLGVLTRGEQVPLVRRSTDGKWCLVDAGGGEPTWVEAAALSENVADEPAGNEAEVAAATPVPSSMNAEAGNLAGAVERSAEPTRRYGMVVGASAGLASLTRRFTSDGSGVLPSYQLQTNAMAATVGGRFVGAVNQRLRLGFDLDYRYVGAASVRYQAPDGSRPVVGVTAHDASAGLLVGVHSDVAGGLDARLRVGAQLQATVLNGSGTLDLPSDQLLGMVIGLGIELPRLFWIVGHPLGLALSGTALAVGKRFENVADGQAQQSYGAVASANLTFELLRRPARGQLLLTAGYAYAFAVTRFSGASQRNPGGTGAVLGDAQHLVTGGLAYSF